MIARRDAGAGVRLRVRALPYDARTEVRSLRALHVDACCI